MDDKQQVLADYYKSLHPVVQEAISSAEVSAHLRKLANTHHLHFDQWGALENQVMLALIGLKRFDEFEESIRTELRLAPAVAKALAADISAGVFVPIREQMERSLSHPAAKEEEGTPIEDMTQEILQGSRGVGAIDAQFSATGPAEAPVAAPVPAPPPVPTTATPLPPPTPEPKPTITRTEAPGAKAGVSSERKEVHNDPYRIAPDAA